MENVYKGIENFCDTHQFWRTRLSEILNFSFKSLNIYSSIRQVIMISLLFVVVPTDSWRWLKTKATWSDTYNLWIILLFNLSGVEFITEPSHHKILEVFDCFGSNAVKYVLTYSINVGDVFILKCADIVQRFKKFESKHVEVSEFDKWSTKWWSNIFSSNLLKFKVQTICSLTYFMDKVISLE